MASLILDTPPITLEAHICAARRSYLVTFATEAQALDFIGRKSSTHAFFTVDGKPIDSVHTELINYLFPDCEHGLSLALCYGPNHYATDEEIRMGY